MATQLLSLKIQNHNIFGRNVYQGKREPKGVRVLVWFHGFEIRLFHSRSAENL